MECVRYTRGFKFVTIPTVLWQKNYRRQMSTGGSVVDFSPATREARVRFWSVQYLTTLRLLFDLC